MHALPQARQVLKKAKKKYDEMQESRKLKNGTVPAKLQLLMKGSNAWPQSYHGGALVYRDQQHIVGCGKEFIEGVFEIVCMDWCTEQVAMTKDEAGK